MISLSAASSQLLLRAPQLALLLIPSQPRQISESCSPASRDCRAGWKTPLPGRALIAGLGELTDASWWGHGAVETSVSEIRNCLHCPVLPSKSDPPPPTLDQEWEIETWRTVALGEGGRGGGAVPQTIVYNSVATCATAQDKTAEDYYRLLCICAPRVGSDHMQECAEVTQCQGLWPWILAPAS